MSKKVDFVLNLPGLNEIMKSKPMKDHLQTAGEAVAGASGIECGVRVHDGSWASLANVYPASKEAALENYKHNNIVKALYSVGLSVKE